MAGTRSWREILDMIALRARGDTFRIHHRPGRGTTILGDIPRSKHPALREFFQDVQADVVVRGQLCPGKPPLILISGLNSPFSRQRVRNYVFNLLS
jgi:hypothetical protein